MKQFVLKLVSWSLLSFAFTNGLSAQDVNRDKVSVGAPDMIYDFLLKLKVPHSIDSSKSLWSFISPSSTTEKKGHAGKAAIRTVLIERIIAVEQSTDGRIVSALVKTEESQVEALVFKVHVMAGKFYISLPDEHDPFSPYITPWQVRVAYPRE